MWAEISAARLIDLIGSVFPLVMVRIGCERVHQTSPANSAEVASATKAGRLRLAGQKSSRLRLAGQN